MAIRPHEDRSVRFSAVPAEPEERHADLLEDLQLLWLDLRGLTHDHLQLAALEARRAGASLAVMLAAGVVMAVLLISVWGGLMAAAALALMQSHVMGDIEAILSIAGANLVAALLLFWFVRRKSRDLLFPETINSFQDKE
ncbi:phage holin family protein [Methylomicrobium sp. RS1]|jgi:hypothetical protein|uniref:phage holin family protein n=1 Tax=Candidatus Methylomicrobium oryzae TaxID=2802053 RepID=UPI0019232FE6|nr:phage holin family protein [Methylomicrobium sp. RS1]MBL1263578.1 phage holin family protein [Methylomicrobium sp. RS1]